MNFCRENRKQGTYIKLESRKIEIRHRVYDSLEDYPTAKQILKNKKVIIGFLKTRTLQQSCYKFCLGIFSEGEKSAIQGVPSLSDPWLLAFSLYSNGKKLLNVNSSPDSLECLHGVRFLSIAWVVLGHRYFFASQQALLNLTAIFQVNAKLEIKKIYYLKILFAINKVNFSRLSKTSSSSWWQEEFQQQTPFS